MDQSLILDHPMIMEPTIYPERHPMIMEPTIYPERHPMIMDLGT